MSTTTAAARKVTLGPKINPKALARYGGGRTLMPLRSATAKDGKLPGRKGWPDGNFVSANVIHNAVIDNVNVGWRLRPEDLVLDIDPRNGGLESFERLCHDGYLNPSKFVKVVSGRGDGGFHLYMTKPANKPTHETLPEFPGIEFKTFGRQVVCAGSLHHATGKRYRFDRKHPRIEDGLRPASKGLLKLIADRPHAPSDSDDVGVMTAEGAALLLDDLDPADVVPDNDAFERFAPAAKKACADENAEACVLEWLARDNTQDADSAAVRWNSYRNDKPGGVGIGTFIRILQRHGVEQAAINSVLGSQVAAADEFPDDVEDDSWLESSGDDDSWLEGKKPKPVMHQVGGLSYQNASEVEPERIEWLWRDRFAIGKINFVAGFPDQGKSQVTCDMAARVSTGAHWPNDEGQAPLGTVLMLSAEDGAADTVVPRLKAAGADLDKIKIIAPTVKTNDKGRRMFNFADDLNRLTVLTRHCDDVRLVIIDPISAYMGGKGSADTYKNTEVRAVLAPLAEWAERHNLAVVFVSHFNKNGNGRALSRLTDSLAFGALARCGWLVVPESDGDGETGRKLFLRGKNNLAADAGGIAYTIEGATIDEDIGSSRIVWHERVQVTADDAMGQAVVKATAQDRAGDFLEAALSNGPVTVLELKDRAAAQSISWRTVERAKEFLGVQSQKLDFGRGWQWAMEHHDEFQFG